MVELDHHGYKLRRDASQPLLAQLHWSGGVRDGAFLRCLGQLIMLVMDGEQWSKDVRSTWPVTIAVFTSVRRIRGCSRIIVSS